ncbi:shugoshin-1-like protein isoform X2, partial [Tanacetum coccineum]
SLRKRLSDITNHQAQQPKSPLAFDDSLQLDALSSAAKEYIDNLLQENARLVKLITDKNKTIETNGVELQKLRIVLRKTQLQNWNLAQSNSQMMAEHNIGKQKLKELQHQLACKDALLKTINSELQAQRVMKDQKSEPKDVDNADTNQQNANRRIRATRTQSISCPMTTTQEVCDEEIADNVDTNQQKANRRIRPTRSQCKYYKTKDLFETEIRPTRSQSIGGPMTTTQHVSDIELTENKRRKVRRQSARYRSQELEPNENLFEIEDLKMHEDGPTLTPGCRGSQRLSLGRPSRRAAEKIQSYKETPLNSKMRRPE